MSYLNRAFIRAYDRQPAEFTRARAPLRTVAQFDLPTACSRLLDAGGTHLTQATQALFACPTAPRGLLFVRGAQPQAGRTTIAICLAQALASLGRKIALVDADWLHPSLQRLLGNSHTGQESGPMVSTPSIPLTSDWLEPGSDPSAINQSSYYSHHDQFTLLPLLAHRTITDIQHDSPSDGSSADLQTHFFSARYDGAHLAAAARHSLQQLVQHFDLVIVDTSCWSPAAIDARAELNLLTLASDDIECVSLIVSDARSGPAVAVQPLCRALRQLGETRIGIIENFCAVELSVNSATDAHVVAASPSSAKSNSSADSDQKTFPQAPSHREELVHV